MKKVFNFAAVIGIIIMIGVVGTVDYTVSIGSDISLAKIIFGLLVGLGMTIPAYLMRS